MLSEINAFIALVQDANLPSDPSVLIQQVHSSSFVEPPAKANQVSPLLRSTPAKIRVRAGFRFMCRAEDLPWFEKHLGVDNFVFEGTTGFVVPSLPARLDTHLRIYGPDTWNESLYPIDWETGGVDEATKLPIPLCRPEYDKLGHFSSDFNRDDFEFHWQYVALAAGSRGHHSYFRRSSKIQMVFDPRYNVNERNDIVDVIYNFLRWNQPIMRTIYGSDGRPVKNRTEYKPDCYERWYRTYSGGWWPFDELLYIERGFSEILSNLSNTNSWWPKPIIWPLSPPKNYNRTSSPAPVQALALPDCYGPRFVMPVSLTFRTERPTPQRVNFGVHFPSLWPRPAVTKLCSVIIKKDVFVAPDAVRGFEQFE